MRKYYKNTVLLIFAIILVGCASNSGKMNRTSNINASGGSEREIYGSIRMGGSYNL